VTDPALGSQDPETSPAPTITYVELIRRVALIHAAIDEYEMKALAEYAMKNRAEERARTR
jgi:hypothetical protein